MKLEYQSVNVALLAVFKYNFFACPMNTGRRACLTQECQNNCINLVQLCLSLVFDICAKTRGVYHLHGETGNSG